MPTTPTPLPTPGAPTEWTNAATVWLVAGLVVILVGVHYAPKLIFPAVGLIVVYLMLKGFNKV